MSERGRVEVTGFGPPSIERCWQQRHWKRPDTGGETVALNNIRIPGKTTAICKSCLCSLIDVTFCRRLRVGWSNFLYCDQEVSRVSFEETSPPSLYITTVQQQWVKPLEYLRIGIVLKLGTRWKIAYKTRQYQTNVPGVSKMSIALVKPVTKMGICWKYETGRRF